MIEASIYKHRNASFLLFTKVISSSTPTEYFYAFKPQQILVNFFYMFE